MSASGAKVMALRSIEVARSYGVKLRVRPTFGDGDGTWIGEEDEIVLEKAIVSGVTHDTSEAKIVLVGRARPPRRRSAHLQEPRRGRRQRRHDRPERLRARHDEHHLHDPESRRRHRRPDPRCRRRGGRRRPRRARSRDREDLADRRGHEEPSRASPPRCSTRSPRPASTSRSSRRRRSASPASSAPREVERAVRAVHARFLSYAEERVGA